MNGREKIWSAFAPEGAAEIPVVIPYEDIFIRDHWSTLSRRPWWVRASLDVETQVTWRREIAEVIGQDWFSLASGASKKVRKRFTVDERDGVVYRIDRLSGNAEVLEPPAISGWSGRGVASIHPKNPPQTPGQVERWIVQWDVPGQALKDGRTDLPRHILADWGAALYPMGYINGPLWSCYYLWGFEGMMTHLVEHPELVRVAVERFTEQTLGQIQVAARLGAKGIWLEDCLTDMVSPQHYATFNLPYLRQLTDAIRGWGMRTVHYFCGNPSGKWELLLDTGADALALEESKKGFAIDIDDVVARVNGRMVVLGNLDAVGILEQADEATMRAEIRRHIAAGRRNGSRFIMSLGSPVTPDTPASRVRLYCDLAHELGR
jgi:hypothetical protein